MSRGAQRAPGAPPRPPSTAALVVATLALFLVWSNTWLAFEVLLAPKSGPAPMTWLDLCVARFVPVVPLCAVWCFGVHARRSIEVVRSHPVRLAVCGFLAIVVYSVVVYRSMAARVSGPVASLVSALAPLFLVFLGAAFLRERIGARQVAGLVLGFAGVALVATARDGGGGYGLQVALLALAPLAWSAYSALTKPVTKAVDALLWTYLVIVVGGAPLLLLTPFHGGPAMARLDAGGWALLLFLSLGGSVFGNAVWAWLLKHLPASTVGLTIFLNPPLTTASKFALAALFPASFSFSITGQEWVGGALALVGVGVAVLRRRPV